MKIDTFKWRPRYSGNILEQFSSDHTLYKVILKYCINDICTDNYRDYYITDVWSSTYLNRFLKTASEVLLRIAKMKLVVVMVTIILLFMLITVKIIT